MRIKVSRNFWIAFVVLAVAVIMVLQPQTTLAQEKFKLKFQATWPAGSTLYENFLMFAEEVKKMSGGRLEIETLPAGAIVPAFENTSPAIPPTRYFMPLKSSQFLMGFLNQPSDCGPANMMG